MDYRKAATEVLLQIQRNLIDGLAIVAKHLDEGTAGVSKKEGSAPPVESGWLTLVLLVGVEDELESRIRGFKRSVDPKLIKTL